MENGKLPETVEYPLLEVEGVPYQVKYTTGTLLRLQREGVNLDKLAPQPVFDAEGKPVLDGEGKPKTETPRWTLDLTFQVLAACISHGKRKFTGEELADHLPAERMGEAIRTLTVAFSKVSPRAAQSIPEATSHQLQ